MTALWIVIKASALLGIAALAQAALRRRASAASRHLIWMLALTSVLLVPAASLVLPAWNVAVLEAPQPPHPTPAASRTPEAAVPTEASAPAIVSAETMAVPESAATVPWTAVVAGVYAAGVLGFMLLFAAQHLRLNRFARRATVVEDADWMDLVTESARRMGVNRSIRLLRSREQTIPLAFGNRRPSIVIPAVAGTWDEDRRRAVVSHELAHVARYDCLTEQIAAVACAVYWFHPAVWWVARRLRIERELACDDRVIAAGTEARAYAGHLLDIAYSFSRHRAPALGVAMAGRGQLEGRLIAALDDRRNRAVPHRRAQLAGLAAAAALVCAVAAARPTAAAPDPNPIDTFTPAIAAVEHGEQPVVVPRTLHEGSILDAARDIVRRFVRSVSGIVGLAQGIPGTWEIRRTADKGTVHLQIVEINSSSGTNIALARLEGLTEAQLDGAGGPVQFHLRRDAGMFTFEGTMRNGVGAGTFSFAPDPSFPAELAKRGFASPTPAEQYQLARHDIGFAFVDELKAQGYSKPQTSDLVKAGQHGVQAAYLRDMGALGYRLGSLDPLINLRDHGITPAYVRDLSSHGFKGLSVEALLQARDHGVTPDYLQGMRDAGYGSLPLDDLVNARDHGVTPEFTRALADAGYGKLALDDVIRARDHGVTPEFIRALADAGYAKLKLDDVIRIRDHGVTPEYIREMRRLGYSVGIDELVQARDHGVNEEFAREMTAAGSGTLSLDALVRLRDHGVTPQYAKDVKALGYDRLSLDDLVTLRDHGLTVERIRSANARAGTRLPIDMLKSLAAGGYR